MDWLGLEPGSHVCLLFESFAEQKTTALPFLQEGSVNGERCVCIAGEFREDVWCLELQSCGVDVRRELARGSLIVGRSPVIQEALSSVQMARAAFGLVQESLTRYSAVRFAVDIPSTLGRELPADQLCHWEATFDLLHAEQPIRTICMYDLGRLSSAKLYGALKTHPLVIVNQRLCFNPYYEAPQVLEHESCLHTSRADRQTVSRMIEELLKSD